MNKKMKVAQISKSGGDWELVERDIPEPGAGQVRVKVEACGICHSDFVVKEGLWPGLQYPRVPGHEVAVHGIGGLGHLGVQYARQMGFKTVALGRGKDKEPLARKLGAHHYIDSGNGDAATELQKLGGARVILATAPNAQAISALVDGLSANGKQVIAAAPPQTLTGSPRSLLLGRRSGAGVVPGPHKRSPDPIAVNALPGVPPVMSE